MYNASIKYAVGTVCGINCDVIVTTRPIHIPGCSISTQDVREVPWMCMLDLVDARGQAVQSLVCSWPSFPGLPVSGASGSILLGVRLLGTRCSDSREREVTTKFTEIWSITFTSRHSFYLIHHSGSNKIDEQCSSSVSLIHREHEE